jgi:Cu/Ag efflux protein CusF
MKNTIILLSILALAPVASFAENIKIINDTSSKISIHTGSGVSNLNKGSSTSFTCKPGKKIYTAKKGMKENFIFKVTSSHCGTSVKLSSVM